jgi:polyhydroxyalkanoate synthesis regulator phasin
MKKKMGAKVMTGILAAGIAASFGGLAFASSYSTDEPAVQAKMLSTPGIPSEVNIAAKGLIFKFSNGGTSQNTLKAALDELVTAGAISRSQADVVFTQFQQQLPQKLMTKAGFPEHQVNKSERGTVVKIVDPLKSLIDKGTLTEDQAQAIRDKMHNIAELQRAQQWQTSLDTLVNKGTITKDQAVKILKFLSANDQKMQGIFNQVKKINPQQMRQYFKQNMTEIKDPISQMVDQGIITKQQADVLDQTMPSLPKLVHMEKPSQQQSDTVKQALEASPELSGKMIDRAYFIGGNSVSIED